MIILETELAQRRRVRAATRALEQRSRLEQMLARLSLCKGLDDTDRRRLARNIGRIAELRAERPKRLLGQAFELWAERDEVQLAAASSRWPKRLRYSRLAGEEQKREPLSADGQHYLALAECLVECAARGKLSAEQNRTHLLTLLLDRTVFDIATSGAPSVDLAGASDVAQLGGALARKLTSAVPDLPKYFERVEALGLTHRRLGDDHAVANQVSGFDHGEFVLSGWDGFGAAGHLVADAIYDEFMLNQHEGTGFIACCPKVLIAHICYSDHIHAYTVSSEQAAALSEADASRAVKQAVDAGEVGLRWVGIEWNVHLVALPGTSEDPLSLSFAVTLERQSPRVEWPALDSAIAEHSFDRSLVDLLDLNAWEADAIVSMLSDAEARILILGGERAAQLLGLRATPTELLDIAALANGLPPLIISPQIEVPDAYSPLAVTTIAGMLDRNLKFVAESESALGQMVADAKQRVANLADQEKKWRAGYVEASKAFDGTQA